MARDPDPPRRISHDELVGMLRRGEEFDDVIVLEDDEVEDSSTAPPARPRGTMRSAARTPAPGVHRSHHVEIIDSTRGTERTALEEPHPGTEPASDREDDEVAASARAVVDLREALGEMETEVLSLRAELLQRERELALVRARRSIAPVSRSTEVDHPSSSFPPRCLRFFAEALELSVSGGWRTAADFVRHFPPEMVMRQLDHHPAVRASFLTLLVGIPERTALRTPTEDAGRLLQASVEEHDCQPESFMRVFHRTAASGYLEPVQAWSFVTGRDLLEVSKDGAHPRYAIARVHVARILDLGMAQRLLSPADVIEGITVEVIAESLASDQLSTMLRAILDAGRSGDVFADASLLAALPSRTLVDRVPLARVVEGVLQPLARRNGFALE